jgi:hypothetical protein
VASWLTAVASWLPAVASWLTAVASWLTAVASLKGTCFESLIILSFEVLKVFFLYEFEHSQQLGNIYGSHCCHLHLLHNF